MTGTNYLDMLTNQMNALDLEITKARHKMELDAIQAKAEGLKQLAALQGQQVELAERIKQATAEHAEAWTDFHKGMQMELEGLRQTFEKWLTAYK